MQLYLVLLVPAATKYRSIYHTNTILRRMATGPPGASTWDDKYGDDNIFAYGTEPNEFLQQTMQTMIKDLPVGAKSLLLADGEGRNGVFLAQQGHEVTSVDFSPAGLKKAEKLAQQKGVSITTICADLADYEFGAEQWDCIVGIFCHIPPPVRSRVLSCIPASLKPGGVFVLECYTPDQLKYKTGGPSSAEWCYSSQMLTEALGEKLSIQQNEELVRDVVEGTLHSGTAAVVQFVGRKD